MDDFDNPPSSSTETLQWIISLAISVICCASLFVVMAFYITDQHTTLSNVSLRMDLLQQRQDRLANDLDVLRQRVSPKVMTTESVPAAAVALPQPEVGGVSADKLSESPAAVTEVKPAEGVTAPAVEAEKKVMEEKTVPATVAIPGSGAPTKKQDKPVR